MKQSRVLSLAVLAAVTTHAALAGQPSVSHSPRGGISTDPGGAWVRPDYPKVPNSQTLKKAGPAAATVCGDPDGYAATWSTRDRWGSFSIIRPTGVEGEVRYCVAVRLQGSEAIEVKYDVIGE